MLKFRAAIFSNVQTAVSEAAQYIGKNLEVRGRDRGNNEPQREYFHQLRRQMPESDLYWLGSTRGLKALVFPTKN